MLESFHYLIITYTALLTFAVIRQRQERNLPSRFVHSPPLPRSNARWRVRGLFAHHPLMTPLTPPSNATERFFICRPPLSHLKRGTEGNSLPTTSLLSACTTLPKRENLLNTVFSLTSDMMYRCVVRTYLAQQSGSKAYKIRPCVYLFLLTFNTYLQL